MAGFTAGFLLSLGLILAIGAQNAFLLKQGLKQQHVGVLCTLCAVSDATLIVLGVFGFSLVSRSLPLVEPLARYGGAAFLFLYGARSFWAAFHHHNALEAAPAGGSGSLRSAVLACLAFTWLNPHVYLDTFVLLGSISTQYPDAKLEYALGASTASFVFFFALGYGARLLAPVFRQPKAWRALELLVGCLMWALAASLMVA